jgi:hypothetical protein
MPLDTPGVNQCAGWVAGGEMMTLIKDNDGLLEMDPSIHVITDDHLGDPHPHPLVPNATRRRRRYEVELDGDDLRLVVNQRDSFATPDGVERVLHWWKLHLVAGAEDHIVRSIEADALAKSENQSDIIAGVDLTKEADIVTSILIDLAQRETKNSSAKFAQILVPELQTVGSLTHKTHRFAGFRVLKAPDVPSVLIEVGYLSNDTDESSMRSTRWRRSMAGATGVLALALWGLAASSAGGAIAAVQGRGLGIRLGRGGGDSSCRAGRQGGLKPELHQGAAQAEPLAQFTAAQLQAAAGTDHPGPAHAACAGGGEHVDAAGSTGFA